jgi:predicted helicase
MAARQSIHTILNQFREDARNKRDLGDRFERLVYYFLKTDPLYRDRFSNVWMWNDFPLRGNVSDVGIDLVAQERATGEYCAIQCKFYLPDHTLSKQDIDSFFTASGKEIYTSCMIVSTTDKWGRNAEEALDGQSKPVFRLRVQDLDNSPVDWSLFDARRPQALGLRNRKQLRPHQVAAIADVLAGFQEYDRGKLIMACGTGKTFTSLHIALRACPTGHVLFLVPSLSLLSQSLREWTAESPEPIHALAVCSDASIGKRRVKKDDDAVYITRYDLAFPATTSGDELVRQYNALKMYHGKSGAADQMTVVFATYQSIEAVAAAQDAGFPDFDLIICDEAHRTTGLTLPGEEASSFVKAHDNEFLRGSKRLYMTATPRLYGDDAKSKAAEADAEICSMDDEAIYGPEFHRLGFGEAVSKGLLADYKVLVLAVDEKYVSRVFQRQLADDSNEMKLEDAVKITGCWNGLAKRFAKEAQVLGAEQIDAAPMKRAVAFSRSISDSKSFIRKFRALIDDYRSLHPDDESMLDCELDHVDGTDNALKRNGALDWLREEPPANTCRVLSNARCLSEGVDVPALDAVLFLNPRDSVIDVVQSVGRVMRTAPGKKYGYIILPIGIPADIPPEEALQDHDRYRIIWQVLQALRAHDDRFNATINKIELNKTKPPIIDIIGVSGGRRRDGGGDGDGGGDEDGGGGTIYDPVIGTLDGQTHLHFPQLEEWKNAIYARIVKKCGSRRYWEDWAKDVAIIAERNTTRLRTIIKEGQARHRKAFESFVAGLRQSINPSISEDDAIEMLSQHIVTRPVFDALFANYSFTGQNPVSVAMQSMLETLHDQSLEKETEKLGKFYDSVRERASGIDNPEGRQRVVIELYDKFFRTAFPKVAERLGIVYTPVEVVDFIVRSIEDVLKAEFGSSVSDKDVHIIDPFTGTGTFLVRLLQSGLIRPEDLKRKFQHELHANEIVLLAYYIAAINIEETYHGLRAAASKPGGYTPFEGIVLTDTFQLTESSGTLDELMFPENNRRVKRQKAAPIRVVIGNPPYSSGQTSENDGNKNLKYPKLDARIRETYVEKSTATNKNSIYDSYIRAIRWASDRINGRGVVAFVTNGSFIDGNAMDGLRACLADEFQSIYVFNLRGNQRTSGEMSRQEGGKIFGSGARTPVAISILVRNPAKQPPAAIYYHDIGDYLSREEKLQIISEFGSIDGIRRAAKWQRITPNASHDWINQRDEAFEKFFPLGDKKDDNAVVVFESYSRGVATSRDAWCYNFSRAALAANLRRMIDFYNSQMQAFMARHGALERADREPLVDKFVSTDSKKISWSRGLKQDVARGVKHSYNSASERTALYRPYCRLHLYTDKHMNDMIYQTPRLFPFEGAENLAICLCSVGNRTGFSAIMSREIPDLHMADKNGASQCFPLYLYEKADASSGDDPSLLAADGAAPEGEPINGYRRRHAIADEMLAIFREAYEPSVGKEDIFYYVYGILHSTEYRTRFAADLKKMLPRIPLTKTTEDFWRFSKAGRELAHWHLNYETVEPFPLNEHKDTFIEDERFYQVQKMTFGRSGKAIDKTTIVYNSHITLSGIPLEAYDYVVNGKPALEWIMERYQVTVDKDSGIRNDPNDWCREHNQPRYIVDLVKRIVRVSLETNRIVTGLPALNERK